MMLILRVMPSKCNSFVVALKTGKITKYIQFIRNVWLPAWGFDLRILRYGVSPGTPTRDSTIASIHRSLKISQTENSSRCEQADDDVQ